MMKHANECTVLKILKCVEVVYVLPCFGIGQHSAKFLGDLLNRLFGERGVLGCKQIKIITNKDLEKGYGKELDILCGSLEVDGEKLLFEQEFEGLLCSSPGPVLILIVSDWSKKLLNKMWEILERLEQRCYVAVLPETYYVISDWIEGEKRERTLHTDILLRRVKEESIADVLCSKLFVVKYG